MGGYEGSDHINALNVPLDLVAATGHDRRLDGDYRMARRLGIRCVRESIGWRLCERAPGRWDLSRAIQMATAARRQGVQILWTLMHYGVPADLTLFDDALIPRFAAFAAEAARVLRPLCDGARVYTPINEISFLTWAATATTEMGPAGLNASTGADVTQEGYLLKQRLVRAALAGMDAIRAADPDARFLHIEPVVHIVPQSEAPADFELAERLAGYQWQALDMLAGRIEPKLGGSPAALEWVGVNHYHNSQWEVPSGAQLAWHLRDPRRQPLGALLQQVWRRYRSPLIVAETGHVGVGRAAWLHETASEVANARASGVPVEGVCLYPLLDRPAWQDPNQWHRSGMWHLPRPAPDQQKPAARHLNRPYARALGAWQRTVARARPSTVRVLLPCPWEAWQGHGLVERWTQAGHAVQLLEPPRPGPGQPSLRHYGLSPHAELLVMHGGTSSGWVSAPSAAQRQLLDAAFDGVATYCWREGWVGDSGWLAWTADCLAYAALPPPPPARRPRHGSYEDEELSLLLSGTAGPLTWLRAPPHATTERLAEFAAALQREAARHPAMHWLVDARAPLGIDPRPNVSWLGPVHETLQFGLAAAAALIMSWDQWLESSDTLGERFPTGSEASWHAGACPDPNASEG